MLGVVILCLTCIGVARQASGQGRGRGAALTLPDGPGKEAVQSQCTKCHALGLIASSGGFTRQGWEELIGTMVSLPPAQRSEIGEYLAKNFPEQPRPKPVVLPGDVKVNIREWNAKSLGSRPHDP
jgi:virginiamycin B lyase